MRLYQALYNQCICNQYHGVLSSQIFVYNFLSPLPSSVNPYFSTTLLYLSFPLLVVLPFLIVIIPRAGITTVLDHQGFRRQRLKAVPRPNCHYDSIGHMHYSSKMYSFFKKKISGIIWSYCFMS